jgi:cyclopropane fatty-acyl-phospholipid synthase-like methyltransferase
LKLTKAELAAMPEKAQRETETLALYQEHDFLEAYALHTARRIERTGYKHAIGGGDNWDEHGDLQRDFLISQGLKPDHRLLEIGCGTGRLARKVVPYLEIAGYVGVDIADAALSVALDLSFSEGWAHRLPSFANKIPADRQFEFDYIWSFAAFIHIPQDVVESTMRRAAAVMHKDSRFYWSYIPGPKTERAGVKTFRRTLADYQKAAYQAGLTFDDVPDWIQKAGYKQDRWTGSQRVALSRLSDHWQLGDVA